MKIENLERANEIQKRMKELERMSEWLKHGADDRILILPRGYRHDEAAALSHDACVFLHGLCIGEHGRLQKEFEEL